MKRSQLWTLAAGSGIAVANLYYAQPLLADIARSLRTDASGVSRIPMLAQLGYAAGMLVLVPLGDAFERRRQAVLTSVATAAAMAAFALAPSVLTAFAVGAATIVPQLLVPFAAHLAPPESRGRALGIVMGGLLVGILLARTVAGLAGAAFGWRAVFWIGAVLMLLLAAALQALLPRSQPEHRLELRALFASLWTLLREQPVLREAAALGALAFASFSVFWTTLIFQLERAFGMGSSAAGLFGLVGVAGALAAPRVGAWADRRSARFTSGVALVVLGASWLLMLAGAHLWALVVGVVLLDLAVQSNHISNQTRIYALDAAARGRLNTVYMVTYFIGGAVGTAVGAWAWSRWDWTGVCGAGALFTAVALGIYFRPGTRRAG